MPKGYWIVKQEPSSYSWSDFVADGGTAWTGVRNFQARNNLQAMQRDDRVLFYHSVTEKRIVGIATVKREAYPDPTDPHWVCVDLAPVQPLPCPVSLDQIKTHPTLAKISLVRQSRLSVIPISEQEYEIISQLAGL